MAQVLPRAPQVPVPPGRRFTWPVVAVLLLSTGLLSSASWVIRWWGVCLPDSLMTEACGQRQSSEMVITGAVPGLPEDLRTAAVLLAVSHLVVALLWFWVPLLATGPIWLRWLTALGGLYPLSEGITDLIWQWQGRVVELSWAATVLPGLVGFIALVHVMARAALECRRAVCLLAVGIVSTTLPAELIDWEFWGAVMQPWDYPPGFGSTAAVGLTGTGVALLVYTLRHHHGHGSVIDPLLTLPPLGLIFAREPMQEPHSHRYRPTHLSRR